MNSNKIGIYSITNVINNKKYIEQSRNLKASRNKFMKVLLYIETDSKKFFLPLPLVKGNDFFLYWQCISIIYTSLREGIICKWCLFMLKFFTFKH